MKQKVFLERTDLETLMRGDELVIAVGDTTVPIVIEPGAFPLSFNGNGAGRNGHLLVGAGASHRKPKRKKSTGKLRRVKATAPDGSRHTVDERVAAHWRNQRGQAGKRTFRLHAGKRRTFTLEQKRATVARLERGESFTDVRKDLNLADSVLSNWKMKFGKKGK